MNYFNALEACFQEDKAVLDQPDMTRRGWMMSHIFNVHTYSSDVDEDLGESLTKTIEAISERTTFELVNDPKYGRDYLIWTNTVLAGLIEWGTSIRGAWWAYGKDVGLPFELDLDTVLPSGATVRLRQEVKFPRKEDIESFMKDLVLFVRQP